MEDVAITVCVREKRCVRIEEQRGEVIWDNTRPFTFDAVAGEYTVQESVFEMVGRPVAEACFAGFHSTCFAYGQTGSGKTHTMMGLLDPKGCLRRHEHRGIAPRALEVIFGLVEASGASGPAAPEFTVECTMVELYGTHIFDLLNPTDKNLSLRETKDRGVIVEGVEAVPATTAQEAIELLQKGNRNRTVGSTRMNSQSSRSHCVFTLELSSTWKQSSGSSVVQYSRMNMVDLAGSERQSATSAVGVTLKEAGQINMSLTILAKVIRALVAVSQGRESFVPYRESKLTSLLKDSLGGNSKTAIVATISPTADSKAETLSTLEFAQSAKKIKNRAVINTKQAVDVDKLQSELEKFKSENMALKNELEEMVKHLKIDLARARKKARMKDVACKELAKEVAQVKEQLMMVTAANTPASQPDEDDRRSQKSECSIENQLESDMLFSKPAPIGWSSHPSAVGLPGGPRPLTTAANFEELQQKLEKRLSQRALLVESISSSPGQEKMNANRRRQSARK
eukprot:m51a1_g11979 putative kinesin-like protein kif15 (512) ;mRNA; f:853332-855434